MGRFARLVIHHRRIVSALWLVLFIGGLFSASQLGNRWAPDFSLPGQPGDQAERQLIDTYGVSSLGRLRRRRHRHEGGPSHTTRRLSKGVFRRVGRDAAGPQVARWSTSQAQAIPAS